MNRHAFATIITLLLIPFEIISGKNIKNMELYQMN